MHVSRVQGVVVFEIPARLRTESQVMYAVPVLFLDIAGG